MSEFSEATDCDIGFVLVHGAGFDVWIWEELVSLVDAPMLPVRFPARAAEQPVRDNLQLVDYVEAIVKQIEEWDVSTVILVGHSIGGSICVEVADRLSDCTAGFVGLCAAIPECGQSFMSCLPFHEQVVQRFIMRLVGTKPPERIIKRSLCAELTDEQADDVISRFVPESRHLYTDPVNGSIPNVLRMYIQTQNDESIHPDQQVTSAETLGTNEVITLNSGHLPMLSCPRELASILLQFRDQMGTR
ncbi:alpha/beta fold hydrolase [Haloarchaeobius amylolyticus]|uniref:alpha/beta fold hydrolase n=1 Tax=Haloarchaeobius amylolyticus TaxID=1198296 RepID=UPI00226DED48|nr:alpha/beta hydrolase [Haloarchaeobius amylolyticus]